MMDRKREVLRNNVVVNVQSSIAEFTSLLKHSRETQIDIMKECRDKGKGQEGGRNAGNWR